MKVHPVVFARSLRRHQTEAENKLWYQLRERRMMGLKFKRQVPVGPFVVDFLCPTLRLVIEADGGQHGDQEDRQRDRYLREQGFTVLRFWNHQVVTELEGVLEKIRLEVEALGSNAGIPLTPAPLPPCVIGESTAGIRNPAGFLPSPARRERGRG